MKAVMKQYYITFLVLIFLSGCTGSGGEDKQVVHAKNDAVKLDSLAEDTAKQVVKPEDDSLNYTSYYIVVIDTGKVYDRLNKKMQILNQMFKIPIEKDGRFYDAKRDLIVYPDAKPDEGFNGVYLPKRVASRDLSIEYMDAYKPSSKKKMMALLGGIYEKQTSADSALKKLKAIEHKSFKIKSKVYVGCIH